MSIEDFRTIDAAHPIEADLCVIGSGPAGWAIAEELRNSGLRILVLESGGLEPESESYALNDTVDVGVPLFNGRERSLGGTSGVWSGRCRAFDDIDFETRSWVPYSGWPIGREDIAPYFDRASAYLNAGRYAPDGTQASPDTYLRRPDLDPALLENIYWQDPNFVPARFGPRFAESRNPNLRVLLHATVTHLNTDPSGTRIESVEISQSADKRATVNARAFVLCAGGIENARILLYSNRVRPKGVGNEHDVVGRFLMDHPRDNKGSVHFNVRDAERVQSLCGPYKFDGGRGRHAFMFGFAYPAERQRKEGLLNAAAWLQSVDAPDDPVRAALRLIKGPRSKALHDAALVISQPLPVLRAVQVKLLRDQRPRHKTEQVDLIIASEQVPDPDSRIELHEQRRDRFGLPLAKINWRINEPEKASQATLARSIVAEFKRLNLPPARVTEWAVEGRLAEAVLVDHCHPSGATRMSSNPRFGVVDADCKVHGVDGLYIAGSSVFPTAGHANPTLMIVSFAIRLAHHLGRRLSADPRLEPLHAQRELATAAPPI